MANKLIKGAVLCAILPFFIFTSINHLNAQGVSGQDVTSATEHLKLSYLLNTLTGDEATFGPSGTENLYNNDEFILIQETSGDKSDRNTTSLTVGYVDDEFLIATDNGSNRFYFMGETAGAMISGKGANLMVAYGTTDATDGSDEIRSLSADLSFGGNVYLFRNFLRLPLSIYVPIRLNAGYRNLSLIEQEDALHLVQAGLGAGAGTSVRIPTGLPVIKDNLTGFASLVRSVGGLGELSSTITDQTGGDDESAISGLRLMQNTDLNIEAKFERLLGENTGVTVGLTIRWQSWTEEKADEFVQVLDVITGQQDNLTRRGKQTFLRVGINW